MIPFFSLVVCTYQRTEELGRLFRSLSLQDFDDFEVVIVDQNLDNRLSPYQDLALQLGLPVRHIKRARPNLSAARNAGIQQCRGHWIGFPDDDCWYEPSSLRVLHESICMRQAQGIASLDWCESPRLFRERFSWRRSKCFRDPAVASFMLFFHHSVFEKVGGFDPRLGVGQWFSAGEETDLLFRSMRSGVPVFLEPDAPVHHPVKNFGSQPGGMKLVRSRARGTGAIYAIHDLPVHVIARGLFAPLVKAFIEDRGFLGLKEAFAEVTGRLEGMAVWKLMEFSHHSNPPCHLEDFWSKCAFATRPAG